MAANNDFIEQSNSQDVQMLNAINKISGQLDRMSQSMLRMEQDNIAHAGGRDSRLGGQPRRQSYGSSSDGFKLFDMRSNKQLVNRRVNDMMDSFFDEFESQLQDALGISNFKNSIHGALDGFARELGLDIDGLKDEFSKQLGKQAANMVKNSKLGQKAIGAVKGRLTAFGEQGKAKIVAAQHAGVNEATAKMHTKADRLMRLKQQAQSGALDALASDSPEIAAAKKVKRDKITEFAAQSGYKDVNEFFAASEAEIHSRIDASAKAVHDRIDGVDPTAAATSPDAWRADAPVESENAALSAMRVAESASSDIETILYVIEDDLNDILSAMRVAESASSDIDTSKYEALEGSTKPSDNLSDNIVDAVDSISDVTDIAKMADSPGASTLTESVAGQAAGEAVADVGAEVAEGAVSGMAQAGLQDALMGAGGAEALTAVGGEVAAGLSAAAPPLLAAVVAMKALEFCFGDTVKLLQDLLNIFGRNWFKEEAAAKARAEAATKRMKDDVTTLINSAMDVVKQTYQDIYTSWDNNLRIITATQGYDKAGLQDLMAAFSERIRSEGLSSVIAGTTVIDNLKRVLESGLSGAVAEEFAYQATLLESAIPSQDFFNFAEQYSSVAANAIRLGMSQSDAIEEANKSLKDFANNTLYASRELAGGFSTGLKNAQQLYEQSIKITQAARVGDSSQISGVLTAVAATVGAVAPDLATSLTDAVYRAAVGGNDSSLVALRSLAGVGASNTEFLRKLATDPQTIFSDLFNNLAKMFGDSTDAYMEKAEGYASLFGLSTEAFQRIDFNYLADAISSMNTGSQALADNMELLASGQTTLTKEQMKNREINQYMIDEGLAYVLDNEAARSIQEHLWEEQLAAELETATWQVEATGKTGELLTSVKNGISKLQKNGQAISNPLGTLGKATGIKALEKAGNLTPGGILNSANNAVLEKLGLKDEEESSSGYDLKDIAKVIEEGVVGAGNKKAYRQLTTYGQDLGIIPNYHGMQLGGNGKSWSDTLGPASIPGVTTTSPTSMYNWGTVSKSSAASLAALYNALESIAPTFQSKSIATSGASSASKSLTSKIDSMLAEDYISRYIEAGDYEGWKASAKSKGISDIESALYEAGYDESKVRDWFEERSSEEAAQAAAEVAQIEQDFYKAGLEFYQTKFPDDFATPVLTALTSLDRLLNQIHVKVEIVVNREDTIISLLRDSTNGYPYYTYNEMKKLGERSAAIQTSVDAAKSAVSELPGALRSNRESINGYLISVRDTLATKLDALNSTFSSKMSDLKTGIRTVQSNAVANTSNLVDSLKQVLNNYSTMTATREIPQSVDRMNRLQERFVAWQRSADKNKDDQTRAERALVELLTNEFTSPSDDPAFQTNELLMQILVTMRQLMMQNNSTISGIGTQFNDVLKNAGR